MSISNSLSNALSGMTASARMAEVVSSNVANALTEGYGRRSVNLTAGILAGQGTGVEVAGITRHMDQGILADRRLADARVGTAQVLSDTMASLQSIIGKVGQKGSLTDRVAATEAAIVDAAGDPSSTARLTALHDRFQDLTKHFNASSRDIQKQRQEADTAIKGQVDLLNASLAKLQQLNSDIAYSVNTGNDPSALIDSRQIVVDTIAELVPVRIFNRENGRVALMTPQGQMLIDGPAKSFGFVENPVITADMTLQSGGLSSITLDGVSIGSDGIGRLNGGSLGALFTARDTELVAAQTALDDVAADLVLRLQDSSLDATILPGQAGLLTDDGTSFDPVNIIGLSSRIAVNANVDPNAGGTVRNLRDGVNATTPGLDGDASLLLAIGAALADPRASLSDAQQSSLALRAAHLEQELGERRLSYDTDLSFESARQSSLRDAEASDGVDTDFEMQVLLRVEQAYAANARVIQTVNSLIQRLMEI